MAWIRRTILATIAAVVLMVGGWMAIDAVREKADSDRLNAGLRYWTVLVDREAPIGANRADVERRFAGNLPEPVMRPRLLEPFDRRLVFFPKHFKVTAFPYPCSDWAIRVQIDFGHDNRVISRAITPEGACV